VYRGAKVDARRVTLEPLVVRVYSGATVRVCVRVCLGRVVPVGARVILNVFVLRRVLDCVAVVFVATVVVGDLRSADTVGEGEEDPDGNDV